jgi:hypothetical protein
MSVWLKFNKYEVRVINNQIRKNDQSKKRERENPTAYHSKTTMISLITLATALLFLLQSTSIFTFAMEPRIIDEVLNKPKINQDTPIYDATEVQSELDSHRATWNAFVGESKNYDMTLERICFCPQSYRGPFSMRVRNGAVVSATYLSDNLRESTVDPELLEGLLTVDGVFDDIQKSLDQSYVEIRVTYNETAGFPSSAYSDMSRMIADGDRTYKISDVALNDN